MGVVLRRATFDWTARSNRALVVVIGALMVRRIAPGRGLTGLWVVGPALGLVQNEDHR